MVRTLRTVLPALVLALSAITAWAQNPPATAGAETAAAAPATAPAVESAPVSERVGQTPRGAPAELREQWLADGVVQTTVIDADGDVDNFMRDSIRSRVEEARALGAEVVILRLDTYGGLVTAGLEISRFLKQQDDLYIVCFVNDKAISAGSMIALACDEIVMEPASQIGDAGVISVSPTGQAAEMDPTARAKGESLVLSDFTDSARRNGYSPLLAESFVVVDRVVYYIENVETGERRFVDEAGYQELVIGGPLGSTETNWQPVPDVSVPLDGERTLLTLSNEAARDIGLSNGTFATPTELASERGWTIVATLTPSTGERLVGFLSSYAVRGVLMTVLFLGIYMSLSSPGTGIPEVVATLALAVLFGVPLLTGYAEWFEVLLVLIGVALLTVELFLIPGFGVAGITGLVMIFLGLTLSFVAPLTPENLPVGFGIDWANVGYALLTTVLGLLSSLLLWFWLSRFLPSLPYANRLILAETPPTPRQAAERAARTAAWPTPGSVGWAVSDLRPGGTAKFPITDVPDDTANADVISDRGFITAGTPLTVIEVSGNRVVVRPSETA